LLLRRVNAARAFPMEEFLHKFGIDIRLIIAQAVNFGIVFFLLYRFAYRPILHILRERRTRIAEGISMREESEKRLADAKRERESIVKAAHTESLSIITGGEERAREREAEIVALAQQKGEDVVAEAKNRAAQEVAKASETFSKHAAALVRDAVAKVVARSPEQIDDALVTQALRAFDHAPKNTS
jgi:F-type H+-transporting ATPase subunit b